jgi:hypothetical protein
LPSHTPRRWPRGRLANTVGLALQSGALSRAQLDPLEDS